MTNIYTFQLLENAHKIDIAIKDYEQEYGVVLGKYLKLQSGQPTLENGYISISHTEKVLVIAISDKKVGIDVENKNRKVHKFDFSILEWTRYEAYAKWSGKGINRQLFETSLPCDIIKTLDVLESYYVTICTLDNDIKCKRINGGE